MAEELIETIEGKTRLIVPAASLNNKVPPKSPAFFNQAARLNRDISVLAYKAFISDFKYSKRNFADSFSGIGARALRVAVEAPEIEQIYLNDINFAAIEMAKKAAELNSVSSKCFFTTNKVLKFLAEHGTSNNDRFSIIDLDPFGSPASYIDSVLRSIISGGLISVTATDSAVLCGVYPDVCMRKYYGRPVKTFYANEVAIRLIVSLIALTASRLDLAIQPLFAHTTMHYLRVYVKILYSNIQANKVYKNIGYLLHCFKCGNRYAIAQYDGSKVCSLCGAKYTIGGPLWVSKLFDKNLVEKMAYYDHCSESSLNSIKKMLYESKGELDDIPYYFRSDEIASKLKRNPQPLRKIIETLIEAGFRASLTSLNSAAFKTNATPDEILRLLK
jgi:tRNA (guanine26-N2/guanine27-N2)-dimethyltransferase